MAQLHAGGFWDKWNSDQFIREVCETKKTLLAIWFRSQFLDFSFRVCRQNPKEASCLPFLLSVGYPWSRALCRISAPLTGNGLETTRRKEGKDIYCAY